MIVACARCGVKLEPAPKVNQAEESENSAFPSVICRLLRQWREFRHIEPSHVMDNVIGACIFGICKYDDGEFVIHIPGDLGGKTLPFAFVLNDAVTADAFNEPAES